MVKHFFLNGHSDILLPEKSYILNIKVLYRRTRGQFPPIPLKIFQSGVFPKIQKFNSNTDNKY